MFKNRSSRGAGLLLHATTRFHHPAMVALDEGKANLKELDALIDLLIAGLGR